MGKLPYSKKEIEGRIASFRSNFEKMYRILYETQFVPPNSHSRDMLYDALDHVERWLQWHANEFEREDIFNGIRKAIKRDAEKFGFPAYVNKTTFCALLYVDELSSKLIDGTYHLVPVPTSYEEYRWCTGYEPEDGMVCFKLVVKDNDGNQVGNYSWTECHNKEKAAECREPWMIIKDCPPSRKRNLPPTDDIKPGDKFSDYDKRKPNYTDLF